jgi:hypothetical protein
VAAGALKTDHHFSELLRRNAITLTKMTYGPVLAENAAEITIGKEYGAGTVFAYERTLFAEMGPPT